MKFLTFMLALAIGIPAFAQKDVEEPEEPAHERHTDVTELRDKPGGFLFVPELTQRLRRSCAEILDHFAYFLPTLQSFKSSPVDSKNLVVIGRSGCVTGPDWSF